MAEVKDLIEEVRMRFIDQTYKIFDAPERYIATANDGHTVVVASVNDENIHIYVAVPKGNKLLHRVVYNYRKQVINNKESYHRRPLRRILNDIIMLQSLGIIKI